MVIHEKDGIKLPQQKLEENSEAEMTEEGCLLAAGVKEKTGHLVYMLKPEMIEESVEF